MEEIKCEYCGYKLPKGYEAISAKGCIYCSEECLEEKCPDVRVTYRRIIIDEKTTVYNNN